MPSADEGQAGELGERLKRKHQPSLGPEIEDLVAFESEVQDR
jgi:hypothetical protein